MTSYEKTRGEVKKSHVINLTNMYQHPPQGKHSSLKIRADKFSKTLITTSDTVPQSSQQKYNFHHCLHLKSYFMSITSKLI